MINTCVLQLERQFQLASIFLTIHLEVTFLKITDFLTIPDIPKREMKKSFTFLPKAKMFQTSGIPLSMMMFWSALIFSNLPHHTPGIINRL